MTPEEKEAADKAAADKAKADKEAADKLAADTAKKEKEAADKAKQAEAKRLADLEVARIEGEKKAKEEAELKAQQEAYAKSLRKKTITDLKSTDDVIVSFKNPVAESEDGVHEIKKQVVKQHVKYAFWLGLRKDKSGNALHSTLRGAKLIGYVEDGEEVLF